MSSRPRLAEATMPEAFNAYHEWLGLPDELASPTYYQILGLAELEQDAAKIAQAGDRALARVRGFRPGSHAQHWSRLLDEINSAKNCLLDPAVKVEYDRCLRRGNKHLTVDPKEQASAAPNTASGNRAPIEADRFPPGMAPPGAKKDLAVDNWAGATPTSVPAPSVDLQLPLGVDHLLPPGAPPAAPAVDAVAAAMAPLPGWQVPSVPAPPGTVGYALPVSALVAGAPTAMSMTPAPVAYAPMAMPVGYSSPPAPYVAAPVVDPMAPVTSAYCAPTLATAQNSTLPAPMPEAKTGLSAASVAVVQARRAQQSQRNVLVAAVAASVVLVLGVVAFFNRESIFSRFEKPVAQAPSGEHSVDTSGEAAQPLPRVVEGAVPTKPQQPKAEPKPEPAPPQPKAEVPSVSPTPESPTTGSPTLQTEPKAEPKPQSPPVDRPEPKSELLPTPAPPPTPEPMPPPMPTKAELVALSKALSAGRAAVAKQDFDAAERHIAEAEGLAKLAEHQEMAARLKEVASYVKQFQGAVQQAVKALEVGAQIKVGTSTMVIVVQVSPERLTIRRAGGNVTYSTRELPPGLAMALAESWLNANDPVNRVIKGAYFAVAEGDADSNREKAKKYWDEAQAGGVDVKPLLPFLTDKYDLEKQAEAAAKAAAKPVEKADEAKGEGTTPKGGS